MNSTEWTKFNITPEKLKKVVEETFSPETQKKINEFYADLDTTKKMSGEVRASRRLLQGDTGDGDAAKGPIERTGPMRP